VNTLKKVKKFTIAAGHTYYEHPTDDIICTDVAKTRINLLLEEVFELAGAIMSDNDLEDLKPEIINLIDKTRKNAPSTDKSAMVEALDALCDIQYILDGTTLALGLEDEFKLAFKLVHQNNMDKFIFEDQIKENKEYYAAKGVNVNINPCQSFSVKYAITAATTTSFAPKGKLLKPKGFQPVNLSLIDDDQYHEWFNNLKEALNAKK
jgi:predicted HAD superfamily Cof-like phosphohydrolase